MDITEISKFQFYPPENLEMNNNPLMSLVGRLEILYMCKSTVKEFWKNPHGTGGTGTVFWWHLVAGILSPNPEIWHWSHPVFGRQVALVHHQRSPANASEWSFCSPEGNAEALREILQQIHFRQTSGPRLQSPKEGFFNTHACPDQAAVTAKSSSCECSDTVFSCLVFVSFKQLPSRERKGQRKGGEGR